MDSFRGFHRTLLLGFWGCTPSVHPSHTVAHDFGYRPQLPSPNPVAGVNRWFTRRGSLGFNRSFVVNHAVTQLSCSEDLGLFAWTWQLRASGGQPRVGRIQPGSQTCRGFSGRRHTLHGAAPTPSRPHPSRSLTVSQAHLRTRQCRRIGAGRRDWVARLVAHGMGDLRADSLTSAFGQYPASFTASSKQHAMTAFLFMAILCAYSLHSVNHFLPVRAVSSFAYALHSLR